MFELAHVSLLYKVLLFIITTLTALITFVKCKDIFSPVKLYLIFNTFFYLDIYFNDYSFNTCLIYLIQCLMLLLVSFFEPKVKQLGGMVKDYDVNNKFITIIWMLSSISILNQILVIIELGGIFSYISNIAFRVEYFKGKGYIIVLNALIATLNVIYFSFLLTKGNISKRSKFLFIFHFLIFCSIGLLSGSRSFILMTILIEIIMYNYLRKPVTISRMLPYVFIILSLVAVLGGLRNSISANSEGVSIRKGEMKLESTHFKYGLIPLEIILNDDLQELNDGATYLSLITNFVPRAIFPDKPDTGGIVFTKQYTGDQWGGLSNLATGAVAEGIINFGYVYGVLIGIFSNFAFYILGILIYRKMHIILSHKYRVYLTCAYVYTLLTFSRYSYSEFSYIFYTLILYIFIPLILIHLLNRLKWHRKIR